MHAFFILIASPGDVQTERGIATEVIHEWNYLNSREKRIVLLPLRWETHSSPELGERAQGVINRQVVDQCDMAIGVFWTPMGTPTSVAESGTAEEVERVGLAGKPVMIYFSRAKVDLESIDLAEYARLKEFKNKTYPLGLIEKYATPLEFRDKLSRQLAIKIRELIAQDAVDQSQQSAESENPLVLRLAKGDPPEVLPEAATVEVEQVLCVDEDEIPDFVKPRQAVEDRAGSGRIGSRPSPTRWPESHPVRAAAAGVECRSEIAGSKPTPSTASAMPTISSASTTKPSTTSSTPAPSNGSWAAAPISPWPWITSATRTTPGRRP